MTKRRRARRGRKPSAIKQQLDRIERMLLRLLRGQGRAARRAVSSRDE